MNAVRIPVRSQDILEPRPITFNDKRILDHISRKTLVVTTVLWHMQGYTEYPAPTAEVRS